MIRKRVLPLLLIFMLALAQPLLSRAETPITDAVGTGEIGEIADTPAPETTEAPETPETPEKTPPPAAKDRIVAYPSTIGQVLYAGEGSTLNLPVADVIAGLILDYYHLSSGHFSSVQSTLQKNIAAIMDGGNIPSGLSEYRALITAAVSDINGGMQLNALKKQMNGKKTKKVSAFSKGVPQIAVYTGSLLSAENTETGYYFGMTGLKGSTKLSSGTYYLQLELSKKTAPALWSLYDNPDNFLLYMPFKLKKKSGGGGGGGGGTTEKALPVARLLVENVHTEPEKPSAGDVFDIVLTLRNTSEAQPIGNIQLTYTTENNVLEPVGGTSTVYIERIDADSVYEQRMTVRAKPDLEKSDVKLDLNADFEDKKLTALTATQSVTLSVRQIQRIQLDAPALPTTDPMEGDSYEVKMGVFNLGKTVLYNVTARAVPEKPEEVSAGSSYFIGNMDPGTSKTVELDLVPIKAGTQKAKLEVTYETVNGETSTASQDISFNVTALENYEYNFEDDLNSGAAEIPVVPETPAAMEILKALPWWLYAGFGGLVTLLLLLAGISARRRRLRALEDDEMD